MCLKDDFRNKIRNRKLQKPNFEIKTEELNKYKNSYEKVSFWHGTGKFKYENGEIIDILENGIKTHHDTYLTILSNSLTMQSISLVERREIARCYADIHEVKKHNKSPYRAGNEAFWLSNYYARMYLTIYTKYFLLSAFRV